MPFMKEMTRIDREFYERLKALDEATLTRKLKPWVLTGGDAQGPAQAARQDRGPLRRAGAARRAKPRCSPF